MKLTITNKTTGEEVKDTLITPESLKRVIAPFLDKDNNVINDLKIEVETYTTIKKVILSGDKIVEVEAYIDLNNFSEISDDIEEQIWEDITTSEEGDTTISNWEFDDRDISTTINATIYRTIEVLPYNQDDYEEALNTLEDDEYYDVDVEEYYNKATYEVKTFNNDDFIKWCKENEREELPNK